MSQPSILDLYVKSAPSDQNALDIFQGEWASMLPRPCSELKAGSNLLFNDPRVEWFVEQIGGVTNQSVLELGPLEAGHTYMLEAMGAARIVAIEANTKAFLKCLIIKNLLNLSRSHFLCGDFIEFLKQEGAQFEIGFASGVLYHMQNPAELIALMASRCSKYLFLWTHYYDDAIIQANPAIAPKFRRSTQSKYDGFEHMLYLQEYQIALDFAGFCGGNAPTSSWMTLDDLTRCLQHFGFEVQATSFDQQDHPNGPAIALVVKRV
jgi:Protein of unknown function (DUF1698)